ncbi:MAG: hypothetical protein U0804_10500 [Gemmataceae bacterium]
MSEGKATLEAKVSEWLSTEGYRLEYLTSKAFRDAGLRTTMSYHVESEEGKRRELDVTAMSKNSSEERPVVARVVCECKYSKEHPWVLLTQGLKAHFWADWVSVPKSTPLRETTSLTKQAKATLEGCWHFDARHVFAHGLVQAMKKDNRDIAFDSLQKIANAAWDCAEAPERRGFPAHIFVIPCIVVEAPLFLSWYNHDAGRFEVKPTKIGRLSWSGCREGTLVDVVHIDGLAEYAVEVKRTLDTVVQVVEGITEAHELEVEDDR